MPPVWPTGYSAGATRSDTAVTPLPLDLLDDHHRQGDDADNLPQEIAEVGANAGELGNDGDDDEENHDVYGAVDDAVKHDDLLKGGFQGVPSLGRKVAQATG